MERNKSPLEARLNTVESGSEITFRVKGSKFIAIAKAVTDENQAAAMLKQIRSRYPDATHHCYAWRLHPENITEFAQDDGEPSGTAGVPILNKLRSRNLIRTLVVVVRYYGGTKLGKGGLIKAYGEAADQVLDEVTVRTLHAITRLNIEYQYSESGLVEQLLNSCEAGIIDSNYAETVTLTVGCPAGLATELIGKLSGIAYLGIRFKELDTRYQ